MAEYPFTLTLRQAARILLEYLALTVLTCLAVGPVSRLLERFAGSPELGEWELSLGAALGSFWAISRALRRHGLAWSHLLVWRVQPAGLVAPFSLLIIGVGILVTGVDNIVESIAPTPAWIRKVLQELVDPTLQPVAGFVAAVVIAPVTEEAICRGLVLRGLLGGQRPARAVVLSSVLFALMHVNPWQMPSAFVGGLFLGWAYLRTRSLGLCVAGHALHNAIWFLTQSLPFEISGINGTPASGRADFVPWWLLLIGVALFATGALWFHRSAPAARPFLSRPEDDEPVVQVPAISA